MEEPLRSDELAKLGLYDPTSPGATDQLPLRRDAFDFGAALEEVSVRLRFTTAMSR